MATKRGKIKKTPMTEYDTSRKDGIAAIGLMQALEIDFLEGVLKKLGHFNHKS